MSKEDVNNVIWFLNLASAYRDMEHEGVLGEFDYTKHTSMTYWLLGCSGPFGIIDVRNNDRITFKQWHLPQDMKPKQVDSYNCGVIWCMFIFEMMCQIPMSYQLTKKQLKSNKLLESFGIGKAWIHPKNFQSIMKNGNLESSPTFTSMHIENMCW